MFYPLVQPVGPAKSYRLLFYICPTVVQSISSVEIAESVDKTVKKRKNQRIVVEKKKFDVLLQNLLKSEPKKRDKIKTSGRKGSKKPLLEKP